MDKQMEQQKEAYRQEAYELLSELEAALLELEDQPEDLTLIGRVFRAMHTIKGSGAMFGFDTISDFTHEIETAYDLVRDGRMTVTKELINLSLAAKDLITEMLDASKTGETADPVKSEEIISALKSLMIFQAVSGHSGTDTISKKAKLHPPDNSVPSRTTTYRIRFEPSEDIFLYGTNPILLLDELTQLGECHVIAHTETIPFLDDIRADGCHIFWDVILTTDRGKDAIEDVFIFVTDTSRISIQVISDEDDDEVNLEYKKLGEILVERGDLSDHDVEKILSGRKLLGELLMEADLVSPDAIESALAEQAHLRKLRQSRVEAVNAASVRVDANKLDDLVDLVGELVTVQARLSRRAAIDNEGELVGIAEEVERLVGELRDNTMGIRMRPISTTFSKFKRLVRDLSETLGKQVTLTTDGGETELDKTVIEQLNDPLVHIIRNSIDHGIETPEERRSSGKHPQGTVHLSAAHIGANVVIRIQDDGAGLNALAIRESALTKGLMTPETELTEQETFELIFEAGFSTAETVTEVSGRGVGMDVVKKRIEALRGDIEISSRKGSGTTITLVLPLTLAIIEGFMVTIGDENFVFPLSVVEECVEFSNSEMETVHRRNMLNIRGKVVPYLSLREFFGINGGPPPTERIVVVESGSQRVGFGVDTVIGQHQTVIKSLGKLYRNIQGISGATILGDGTVALILDVAQLMKNTDAAEPQMLNQLNP